VIVAPALRSLALEETGAAHGFFGRKGGVSKGFYESLNCGLGTRDDPRAVAENRTRCAAALGVAPGHLLTLRQVHSAKAVIVHEIWGGQGPEADAMATRMRGVALGVLAADCMPFLLVDAEAGVVGAAHAGWKGALSGVIQSTVDAMAGLGAEPSRIRAALGPCLRLPNFEVGMDLVEAFIGKYPYSERFFASGASPSKRQFDLAGFGRWRLEEAGVSNFEDLNECTLAAPEDWFSYRASRRADEDDYGRNLSAIALQDRA
jgi:YfiH family protein